MIVSFPATIKCTIVDALFNRYPPVPRFLFEEDAHEQCTLQTDENDYPNYGPWLYDHVQAILATGLTDADGPDCWFRYQGFLLFFSEKETPYIYEVYTDATPLKRYAFDIRRLSTWSVAIEDAHEQESAIRAAIDIGELALGAPALTCIVDNSTER